MARKPHDPIEPEVLPGKVPGHAITLSEEAAVKQIEQDQFAMVMQDIGAMRALSFIRKISGRAQVELYLKLKETKGWKSVPHPDGRKFSDLDELCDVYLGETGRSIRNKVPNYHLLGPALYEVSERMGFKPRDYAALKALPTDDQEAIKQAMQTEDRDQILDLMQELAMRHASEKAQLNTNIQTKEADLKARDAREAKLNADNHELLKRVIRIEEATPQEDYAMLAAELAKCVYSIQTSLMSLRAGFSKLIVKGDEHGIAYTDTLVGHVTQLHRELNRVRNEYGLPIEPDKTEVERGFEFAEAELAREQAERDHTIN